MRSAFHSFIQRRRDYAHFMRQRLIGFPALKRAFFSAHGYPLNLENPKTHSERINHKKIYDRDPLLTLTSDKLLVRDYVKKSLGKEGESLLVPLYYVSKTGKDIPFHKFDQEVFMKANHYSGGNRLVSPGDDPEELRDLAVSWIHSSYGQNLLEWANRDIPRRILIEKVIRDKAGALPSDYKFYCFNGVPQLLYILKDRFGDKVDWFLTMDLKDTGMLISKNVLPDGFFVPNLDQMIEYAKALSKPFTFVRVDFYSLENELYLGELTHYDASGFEKYKTYEIDLSIGDYWFQKEKW
ncbi:MAG: hypothetical protein ACJAWX_003193 [Algoriphagus sp.]|jgi:hypothetical protein